MSCSSQDEKGSRKLGEDHLFAVRLMEHLVVPTFVLSATGEVLIWNRACERLTGLAAAEVVGTNEHWRAFYDARRPCLADLVLSGKSSEVASLYDEHNHLDADHISLAAENWCVMPQLGARRYLAIDAGPIFADTGELIAVVETLRDITAAREAQLALKSMANADGLTGLANRRRFDEFMSSEWRRAQRDGLPLSLLMIDVDHFKSYNDALGHQAGDGCLRTIASLISDEALRPGDQAARYGGEEFAVVLPNTRAPGAFVVAHRIVTRLAARKLPHPGLSRGGIVSVSIGVATRAPTPTAESRSLITDADVALYEAKRAGRGRAVLAGSRSLAA